ncbi:MAG: Sec63 [Candelina submexicana]|nr:MAG: Sec63 [Candelina submexicana]
MKYAELKPDIPASLFPPPKPKEAVSRGDQAEKDGPGSNPGMNISRRRSVEDERSSQVVFGNHTDEFGLDGLDDVDFVAAVGDLDFNHIDGYNSQLALQTQANTLANRQAHSPHKATLTHADETWEPVLLKNGKWACNHACKDKTSPAGSNKTSSLQSQTGLSGGGPKQKSLVLTKGNGQKEGPTKIEVVDLANTGERSDYAKTGPRDYRKLDRLHSSVQKAAPLTTLPQKPKFSYLKDSQLELSFLGKNTEKSTSNLDPISSDYNDSWMDDMPSPSTLVGDHSVVKEVPQRHIAEKEDDPSRFDDDISSLEDCMIGLEDSIDLEKCRDTAATPANEARSSLEDDFGVDDANDYQVLKWSSSPLRAQQAPQLPGLPRSLAHPTSTTQEGQSIFLSTSSTGDQYDPTRSTSKISKRLRERSKSITVSPSTPSLISKKQKLNEDTELGNKGPCESLATDRELLDTKQILQEGDEGYRRPGWEGIDQELYDMFKDIVDIVPAGDNI